MILFSDHDYPDTLRLKFSPDRLKKDGKRWTLNNAIFFTGLKIAIQHGLDAMIYLESDCRVGVDSWDRIMTDYAMDNGGIDNIVAWSSLVFYAPCNYGSEYQRRWLECIVSNTRKNYPIPTYGMGGMDDRKDPILMVNGALGIYNVKALSKMFLNEMTETTKLASSINAWDFEIGRRSFTKYGMDVFNKFKMLPNIYSSYGNIITNELERRNMLESGKFVAVHQIESEWEPSAIHDSFQGKVDQSSTIDNLTVCITSFKRPDRLVNAVKSCIAAGVKKIAVANMEPDEQMYEAMQRCREACDNAFVSLSLTELTVDLGCNELWLRAAYLANTEYVLILHDDDTLDPSFGSAYKSTIAPAMASGDVAVTWRGRLVYDDGSCRGTEYMPPKTCEYDIEKLKEFLLKRGRLSLSPIVTVFNRDTLIASLKESAIALDRDECRLKKGMELGTEIIAHYRQAQTKRKWLFLGEVLSNYGAHAGSGTVDAQKSGYESKLVRGYDAARDYLESNPMPIIGKPRIIFVSSHYEGGINVDEAHERILDANRSGLIIRRTAYQFDLPRNSASIGESVRCVPFVSDLIEHGMKYACIDDVIMLVNSDIEIEFNELDWGKIETIEAAACERRTYENDKSVWEKDGGFDLFIFRARWWLAHKHKFPDMLLGREAWDWVFRTLIESTVSNPYIDLPIYHRKHFPHWQTNKKMAGQVYNLKLARKFFADAGIKDYTKHIDDKLK